MNAVVTGLIGAFPVGGVFWDYVQYALALERLGFEVFYLEDTMQPSYDPQARDYDYDLHWERTADYLQRSLANVSPDLARRWHLYGCDGRWEGLDRREMLDVVADAAVFLNVSGVCPLRTEYLPSRRKVLIDSDPGWNHYMRFPKADADPDPWDAGYRAHDAFFTYAVRMGRPDCPLPDLGLDWHPTRPPVLPDLWTTDTPPGRSWTTVLSWNNAPLPITSGEVRYGTKEREFAHVEDLPGCVDLPLEVAVGGTDPPVERWRRLGWSVVDSASVSHTPDAYRDYITGSRGELSVAKHVYVATRCGWFSCRSICYLAAGRPVVLQDTGFSQWLPVGEGVLAFTDAAEAITALRAVEADHARHAHAARELAERFEGTRVVAELLDRAEVNG